MQKNTLCWQMHQKGGNNLLKVCPSIKWSLVSGLVIQWENIKMFLRFPAIHAMLNIYLAVISHPVEVLWMKWVLGIFASTTNFSKSTLHCFNRLCVEPYYWEIFISLFLSSVRLISICHLFFTNRSIKFRKSILGDLSSHYIVLTTVPILEVFYI